MVHLEPLPGTPFHREGSFYQTLERAVQSARALHQGGADGCLVQTVDRVYGVRDESDPARTAAMSLIARSVVEGTGAGFQVGVQMLRNSVKASLAVAKVAGGHFIRAGAIVGRTTTVHGIVEANPLDVMHYRSSIAAWDVKIIADVHSMHFTWYGDAMAPEEVARAAQHVGADAVCLGDPDEDETARLIAAVRATAPDLPVILAGYTNHANAARLLALADGAFVGRCLEPSGWGGPIDVERVKTYVDIVRGVER